MKIKNKKKIYKKIISLVLALSVFISFSPVTQAATTDSKNHNVTFSLQSAVQLNTIPAVSFGNVDPSGSPYTSAEFVVQLKSNANWTLKVKSIGPDGIAGNADDNYFKDNNGSGSNTITVNDHLEWSTSPYSAWNWMTTTDATIKTGTKNSDNNWQDILMKYRLTINWSDQAANNYLGVIQYTVTTL